MNEHTDPPHGHSPDTGNPEHTDAHGAAAWDERYADADQLWSGHVNGSLEIEAGDLPAGRALDVGCGEGADAIWLAERGWTVTAVDISSVAVDRARAEAERRGVVVDWLAGDLLDRSIEPRAFDLVSLQYPAFDIARLDEVVETLERAVGAGGVLLVVGHAIPDDAEDLHFDPADYVQPADIAPRLGDGWTVEVHEERPRPGDHHHGGHFVDDVILRASRA
ncbi:MAG: methyltransferase domain-containing protein [Actinomycetota bacterium]